MQSANRFSALESDDEVEIPEEPVKKQPVQKKNEKKQQAPVKQEQEKKPKNVNKNEGVEMEFKKQDLRRGTSDKTYGNRETYTPRQGKRQFERRDGTGRAHKNSKKEGAGQHNWGNDIEEELNIVDKVEEIAQVPEVNEPIIEKADQIGKGIEETTEKTNEVAENPPAKPQEKQLTLEEFRKQQKEARKKYQNKELFSVRQERTADVIENAEVVKIATSEDEELIKASTTSKPKKKKVQRSQKTVLVEKDVIGFSPNARRLPRTDKPKTSENPKPFKKEGDEQSSNTPRRESGERPERGERGPFRGPRGRGDFKGNSRGGFKKSVDIDDVKSFPVLKV